MSTQASAQTITPLPFDVEEAANRIAVPPEAIRRVLEMMEDESATAAKIAAELEKAPEVAGRLLRVANGGFPTATGSLQQAVVRIGDRPLSGLLLATTLSRRFEAPLGTYGMGRGAFQRRAEAVAEVAQGLAKRLCPRKESTARMAGLLHDVGKLVLGGMRPLDPDGWEGPPPGDETEWERRVFGVSHDVVGGWLCRRFHAPEELWRAVHEHEAQHVPIDPVSRTTWLANIVVAADGKPAEVDGARRALEAAGVDPRWLERSTGVVLTPPCPLTARELEALGLLWERGSGEAAAEAMDIDIGEFEGMMVRSCKVLEVPSVTRAIATCRRLGWLAI